MLARWARSGGSLCQDAAKTDRQKKVFSDNVAYFEKEIKWFRENFPRRKS